VPHVMILCISDALTYCVSVDAVYLWWRMHCLLE